MTDRLSRLEAAERRLDDALARFETALARAGGKDGLAAASGSSVPRDERGTLRDERGRLDETLADVRRHNDELRQLSRDAASRLDAAIAQIDLLLED